MQSNVSVPASGAARSFLFAFLFVPVLAFLFPIVAERAPILKELSESYQTHALDYPYTASGENADIVFFGDSTALYGPDMSELSHLLGMKVINLPESANSLPLTHDTSLVRYLAHNKAPKLIVLHLAPWDLDIFERTRGPLFDGEEQILRHGSLQDIIQLIRAQPIDMMLFEFRFYRLQNRLNWLWNHTYTPLTITQGHASMPTIFGPMTKGCRFPDEYLEATKTTSAEQLVKKFGTPATKIMLYLAPLPDCENLNVVQKMSHGALQVDPSIVLPPNTFANDSYSIHPLAISSEVRTQAMAESIRKALAK
jgi:hypothetical protein